MSSNSVIRILSSKAFFLAREGEGKEVEIKEKEEIVMYDNEYFTEFQFHKDLYIKFLKHKWVLLRNFALEIQENKK
jgi:hypothetical protein